MHLQYPHFNLELFLPNPPSSKREQFRIFCGISFLEQGIPLMGTGMPWEKKKSVLLVDLYS